MKSEVLRRQRLQYSLAASVPYQGPQAKQFIDFSGTEEKPDALWSNFPARPRMQLVT